MQGTGQPAQADPTNVAPGTKTRRARLFVTRLEPYSVAKSAFVLSLSLAVIIIVATILMWLMLSLSGTFDVINSTVDDIGGEGASAFDIFSFVSFGRIVGLALVIAAFEIVLTTVLATIFAAIYNATVTFTGGVEVTLSEDQPVA
ncbi:MAG: DUF3566 domain-containing protein [Candidatus Nanopelagicales bacterium]